MSTISRIELYRLIDELPEPAIPEVAQFVEFMQFKLGKEIKEPTYVPIALGGLWQGLIITDEEISTVRQEMWQKFGEAAK